MSPFPFLNLPEELIQRIFLVCPDPKSLSQVNKHIHTVSKQVSIRTKWITIHKPPNLLLYSVSAYPFNAEVIDRLLNFPVNYKASRWEVQRSIQRCWRLSRTDQLRGLLEYAMEKWGSNFDVRGDDSITLVKAARKGTITQVKEIIEVYKFSDETILNEAFKNAYMHSHDTVYNYLWPQTKSSQENILEWFCCESGSVDGLKRILDEGIVNPATASRSELLELATSFSDLDVITCLLTHESSRRNYSVEQKENAFLQAVRVRCDAIVRFMMDNDVCNGPVRRGLWFDACRLAVDARDLEIFEYLLTVAIRRGFQFHDPTAKSPGGGDLTMVACEDIEPAYLAEIVGMGGSILPRHWMKCIEKEQTEQLELILDAGYLPSMRDEGGFTLACSHTKEIALELLFKHVPLYDKKLGPSHSTASIFTVPFDKAFEDNLEGDKTILSFVHFLGRLLRKAIAEEKRKIAECLLDHGAYVDQSIIEAVMYDIKATGRDELLIPTLRNVVYVNRYQRVQLNIPRLLDLVHDTPLDKYLKLFLAAYHGLMSRRNLAPRKLEMVQLRLQSVASDMVYDNPMLQTEVKDFVAGICGYSLMRLYDMCRYQIQKNRI